MTHLREIKNAIHRCKTPDDPAHAADVQELLASSDTEGDLLNAYQEAKRHGEIYEYPAEDTSVVKITDVSASPYNVE